MQSVAGLPDVTFPSHPLLLSDPEWQSTLSWQPGEWQMLQFQALYAELIAGNRQFNLTRITDPRDFWEKHLWDSLWGIMPWMHGDFTDFLIGGEAFINGTFTRDKPSQQLRVIDIGTGAGFPGVPIAIARPTWTITLLDATRKKIAFLDRLQQALGLDNIVPLYDRAEQIGHSEQYRHQFDLVVIRAVSTATVCAEYALPLLKVGGMAILYRGQWTQEDTTALEGGLNQLGGAIAALTQVQTPLTGAQRHCVYIQKEQPTPTQFPRRVGVPQRSPLR